MNPDHHFNRPLNSPRVCCHGSGRSRLKPQRPAKAKPAKAGTTNTTNSGLSGRAGFTLVELMVVMLIIAVLASITVPAMKGLSQANRSSAAHRQFLDDLGL